MAIRLINLRLIAIIVLLMLPPGAEAKFSVVQINNASLTAAGYLLDGSAGFLLGDAGGKLFAR